MRSVAPLALFLTAALAAVRVRAAEPALKACAVLSARLTDREVNGESHQLDTKRIQDALNVCAPGQAVVLKSAGNRTAFESAPLILPRGVTLFIDRDVTLFASRKRADYDLGERKCGSATLGDVPACKPFLFAYQAAYSAITGGGT